MQWTSQIYVEYQTVEEDQWAYFPLNLIVIVSFHIQSIKSSEPEHQMLLQFKYLCSPL